MQVIMVEVKDSSGLKILQGLEQANIIKLLPSKGEDAKPKKLSERLRGSISKETARQMQVEVEQMRKEWQLRDS